MAQIPDGILGALIGKIGPVTGYTRNGQNIIRTAASRKDGKLTPGRIAQREKIKVCNAFTKAFSGTGFFNKTFPSYGKRGSGYNRATSAIMNNAVIGTYPDISLSYPDVTISKGTLPAAQNAAITVNKEGNLSFTWKNNSKGGKAKGNDQAVLVAYFPALQQAVFSIGTATRKDGKALLQASILKGSTAETYLSFINHDQTEASSTIYTGSVSL